MTTKAEALANIVLLVDKDIYPMTEEQQTQFLEGLEKFIGNFINCCEHCPTPGDDEEEEDLD